jgi:YggT family protein
MLHQIISLLLQVVVGLVTAVCLLRLYLQHQRIAFSIRSGNPLGPFIFALTDWLVLPLRRIAPPVGRWDTASLLAGCCWPPQSGWPSWHCPAPASW